MISFLFLFLILCSIIWVYTKWLRVKKYWADRSVPHLPPNPVLGSLTFLTRQNPATWIRQLQDRLQSPYIGIWLFWRPALVINDPDIIRRILVTDSDNFRDRLLGSGESSIDPLGSLNLFTVNEPIWSTVRRHLTTVFTSAKLKIVETLVYTKCQQLVQRIRVDVQNKKFIDLRTMYSDLTTDIISIAAFGVDGDATLKGESPMREVTKELMKFSVHRGLSWATIFFFPEIKDIFKFRFFPKVTTDYFRKIFKIAVSQRGGYEKEIVNVKDLLDALMKMKQDFAKNGNELSEDLLIAQAAVFLQGGFDTTSVALTYCTYELAHSPEVQTKVYEELLEAKRNLKTEKIYTNTLITLPYLCGVIKETLRKYPPMGWLDRIASKDYKIDDKLEISAGTPVYLNAYGLQFDPEYFPNPEQFLPERFLPENEKYIKPYTYMPFGEGPRHCIGMRFALQTFRHCLAAVVLNFEIRPLPNSLVPNDCPLEKNGLFLMPSDILSVQFIERNNE